MVRHLLRSFSVKSLGFFLLLTIVSGVFVYQVSPLRDPAFQPNSGNGGTLVPWLRGIGDTDWLGLITLLAGALATNVTVLIQRRSPLNITRLDERGHLNGLKTALLIMVWLGLWVLIFGGFWVLFIGFLLNQWILD